MADANDLPFDDDAFDAATMGLLITFVGDQLQAVTEMKRVVRHGGTIATCIWDIPGDGHFQQPIRDAVKSMGIDVPPNENDVITRSGSLANLFSSTGLDDVSGRVIEIQAKFSSFEDYWVTQTIIENNTIRPIRAMSDTDVERLKDLLRKSLPTDTDGHISYPARCNAVKGIVLG